MKSLLVLLICVFQLQSLFSQENQKTILKDNSVVTHTNNGFTIKLSKKNYRLGFDKISVVFKNKTQTSGTISYYVENLNIGEFPFKNGVLLKGKMTCLVIAQSGFGFTSEIQIKGDTIVNTYKMPEKFKIYNVISFSNKIPNKITYLNHKLLRNHFVDESNEVTLKQYLLDGTLISEGSYGKKIIKGTFIDFKELDDGNIVYSIDYYKKGVDKPIRLKGLNFEEMLAALKKIKK